MADETPKPELTGEQLVKDGGKWMEKIRAAEKREKQWREDAKAAEKAYAADVGKDADQGVIYDFNILHSNVETIVPAIYNSTPVPDVRRRWVEALGDPPQDPTPQILEQAAQQAGISPEQAQQAAQTPEGQQMAQMALQQPQAQQAIQQFQQAMQAYQAKAQGDADAKGVGQLIERGITVQIDDNKLDVEIESVGQDAFMAGRGIIRLKFDMDEGPDKQPTNERFEFEAVSWRDFRMGPATRWENVPWIAFRHVVPRETLESDYADPELMALQANVNIDATSAGTADVDDDVAFWEVWCKAPREVKFILETEGKIIKMVPDPLGLKDFYPIPKPVQPITLTAKMTPVNPFVIYKKLADELDLATKRINKIMKGLKVRGLVAGNASKLVEIANLDDNELSVDSDLEGLAQTGLDKAVLWWPVEQSIKVLQQLYEQREAIKSAIYEITGISDIVRGASNANETLGAQEIKTKWGALRIQKMQRMVERVVRDVFAMMAEILVSGKFSDQTLQAMTGIQITDGMRALMQQPLLTSYRVDVESDSTVRADLTHVKSEMTEFLGGTAQYFSAMQPLVMASPKMAKPVAEIYSAFAGVYNLGKQAEDALEEMVQLAKAAPDEQKPDPEQMKLEGEMKLKEADAQAKAADREANAKLKEREMAQKDAAEERKAQREIASDQAEIAQKQALADIDLQIAGKNLQIKEIELEMKREEAALRIDTKAQEAEIGIAAKKASAEQAATQPAKK